MLLSGAKKSVPRPSQSGPWEASIVSRWTCAVIPMTKKLVLFIALQVLVVIAGAFVLWWLVEPESFAVASADSTIAGAVAVHAEVFAIRRGWW